MVLVYKKYKDMNLREKEKYWKHSFYFLLGTTIIIAIVSISAILSMSGGIERRDKLIRQFLEDETNSLNTKTYNILDEQPEFNITYINVSDVQKKIIAGTILEVKPIYLTREYNLVFAKDIDEHCAKALHDELTGKCNGVTNHREKTIYIKSDLSKKSLRMVLCHELLHPYFDSDIDAHRIVYDLGLAGVCFK